MSGIGKVFNLTGSGGVITKQYFDDAMEDIAASLDEIKGSITGGTDTSDATAAAGDILKGKTAYNKDGKVTGTIESRTVGDLTVSGPTIIVPKGYYANQVSKSVESVTQATPSISVNNDTGLVTASTEQGAGYVPEGTKSATLQLSTQAAQTITPGTTDKTIPAGKFLTGKQTIKGAPALLPENIKEGVEIFGIMGSYTGQTGLVPVTVTFNAFNPIYDETEVEASGGSSIGMFSYFDYYSVQKNDYHTTMCETHGKKVITVLGSLVRVDGTLCHKDEMQGVLLIEKLSSKTDSGTHYFMILEDNAIINAEYSIPVVPVV